MEPKIERALPKGKSAQTALVLRETVESAKRNLLPPLKFVASNVIVQKMGIFSYITAFAGIDPRLDTWYCLDTQSGSAKPQGPFNALMMDVYWRNNTIDLKNSLVYCTEVAFISPSTGKFNKNELKVEEFVPVEILLDPNAPKKVKARKLIPGAKIEEKKEAKAGFEYMPEKSKGKKGKKKATPVNPAILGGYFEKPKKEEPETWGQ